eukprot:GSChrysophyteH1.ASY1.ANO1.943.1 assembled CDS
MYRNFPDGTSELAINERNQYQFSERVDIPIFISSFRDFTINNQIYDQLARRTITRKKC